MDSFFFKKPKASSDVASTSTSEPSPSDDNILASQTTRNEQSLASPEISDFSSDIGEYIETISKIDDATKARLLQNHWKPPADYKFPHSVVKKAGIERKKYAQGTHLEKYHWLVLSHKDQGLYCKYCVLFGDSSTQKNHQSLRRLVKESLKRFDKLLGADGALPLHEGNQYHMEAVLRGKEFLKAWMNPALVVLNQVSKHRGALVMENRERLRPIVETIILCGRQNIPLRGHRDDGDLLQENTSENEGNFRALLKYRIQAGDTRLQTHLQTTSSNATYISKTTQNQLIDCCRVEIQKVILDRVREARYFSVLFDETTDLSRTSQLSLSIRYCWDGKIREDFLTFCKAYGSIRQEDVTNNDERRLSGVAVAHIVEDLLKNFNIDLNNCVGIGVDSCSVMASADKGAVQELKKKAVNAKWCPCLNHALNNALARSTNVTLCRNATGKLKYSIGSTFTFWGIGHLVGVFKTL